MPKRIKPYNNLGGQDVSRQLRKRLAPLLEQQNANQPNNKKHLHHHVYERSFGANTPGDRNSLTRGGL
jgi:hypothetical protein